MVTTLRTGSCSDTRIAPSYTCPLGEPAARSFEPTGSPPHDDSIHVARHIRATVGQWYQSSVYGETGDLPPKEGGRLFGG
jgi:hypothetical protein